MWRAERLEIQVLVENWVDMLLPDVVPGTDTDHCVTRTGLIEHFDPKLIPPQAENGISLLVRAFRGAHRTSVLFDVGLTGRVLEHNLGALKVDPGQVDHVVISHGHPDHYGGIAGFLDTLDRPVPVLTHPDAFLPRYVVMGDGRVAHYYNQAFTEAAIEAGGGRTVLSRDPVELGPGIVTTGQIPRTIDFEGPRPPATARGPGLYQLGPDGEWRLDEVWDEQGLVIDVEGEGLVVLTGCAHAGVVNTLLRAQEVAGTERPLRAVMGGFHLGFPTTPAENVAKTVELLTKLGVQTIVPMHCSGLRAHAAVLSELPDRYVQPAVGTTLTFGR